MELKKLYQENKHVCESKDIFIVPIMYLIDYLSGKQNTVYNNLPLRYFNKILTQKILENPSFFFGERVG